MRRSLTPGHAAIDCINHTLAKVGRERFRHVGRPPSPADTMNQKPPDFGNPQSDFIGSRNALVTAPPVTVCRQLIDADLGKRAKLTIGIFF